MVASNRAVRRLVVLSIEVLIVSLVSWSWAFFGLGAIAPERVNAVAQGILQVVGFLVGGYSVGAFLFFSDWEGGVRQLTDTLLTAIDPHRLDEFYHSRRLQTISVFILLFAPLGWFGVSGISAVTALANGQEVYDKIALGALGIGFGFMPLTLYTIRGIGERARRSAGAWTQRLQGYPSNP